MHIQLFITEIKRRAWHLEIHPTSHSSFTQSESMLCQAFYTTVLAVVACGVFDTFGYGQYKPTIQYESNAVVLQHLAENVREPHVR